MKLGVISDVHGDPRALASAWEHMKALGAEKVVCAGDVAGYGPNPAAACAFLEARGVQTARGNHDRWAIERRPWRRDPFGGGNPGRRGRAFLRDLPTDLILEDGGRIVVVVHGSIRSDLEFIRPATHPPEVLREDLQYCDADLLLHGHTHVPMWYRDRFGLVVNPGSLVSASVVRSSQTFALVDLASLAVSFHDVESGEAVEVPPWPEVVEVAPGVGP